MFWIYLIVYPVGRFMLEFIRLDPSLVGRINANQATMVIVALFGVIMLVGNHIRKPGKDDEKKEILL